MKLQLSHLPKTQALIGAVVFDPKTRRLIEVIEPRPANTFLQNYLKALYCAFLRTTLASVPDVTNTARTMTGANGPLQMNAANTDATFGIVIGTGTNAVVLADYGLQTKVSTNIAHGVMSCSLNSPDGDHYQVLAQRTITNNSGAQVDIREVGIYSKETTSSFIFCLDRTLFSVDVPNAGAVTLTYTWNTSL